MTKWALLTAGLLLLAIGWSPLPGQERNQALRQLRQEDRVLSPDLEIREFSGEFERWSKEVTLSAPGIEVFRWSTPASGTASARWSVLDGPPGSEASVLGSGSAGSAPEPGSVTAFRIDFSQVIPAGQPTAGRTYWVVLEPIDAARQVGPMSAPVQVTYAGQVDIGAFAGREADIVAPPQADLSEPSKLAFLRDLVGGLADLPAADAEDLESAVAAGDVPDVQVRLTPREPVSFAVSPNAVPAGVPHVLEFDKPRSVWPWTAQFVDGGATLLPESGAVIHLALEPGQIYLLEMHVSVSDKATDETTLSLFPWFCLIDFEPERKVFAVSKGSNILLATLKRPSSTSVISACRFRLNIYDRGVPQSEDISLVLYSAELTKLAPESP